jgi:hypothetical protein
LIWHPCTMLGQRPLVRCPLEAGSRHLTVAQRFRRTADARIYRRNRSHFHRAHATETVHVSRFARELHVSVRTFAGIITSHTASPVAFKKLSVWHIHVVFQMSKMHACQLQHQTCCTPSEKCLQLTAICRYVTGRRYHMGHSAAASRRGAMAAAF